MKPMKQEFRLEGGSKLRRTALVGAVFVALSLFMTAARAVIVVVAPEALQPSSTVSTTWVAGIQGYPNKPGMAYANTAAGVAVDRALRHRWAWRAQEETLIDQGYWILLADARRGKGYSHGHVYLLERHPGYTHGRYDAFSERAYRVRSHLSRAAAYRNGLFVR